MPRGRVFLPRDQKGGITTVEKVVDARGQACPQPVLCTKKALEEVTAGALVVQVDNEVARDNVRKFAQGRGCQVDIEKQGGDYALRITKGELAVGPAPAGELGAVVLIPTDRFGSGSDELGALLMKMFLHTVGETDDLPAAVILINGGVKLAVVGAETVTSLIELAAQGVEILVCGTCLDYFQVKDQLAVGVVSNIYTIAEKLLGPGKVVTVP